MADLKIKTIFRGVDKMSTMISRVQSKYRRFASSARRGMARVNRASTKVAKIVGKGLVKGFKAAAVAAAAFGAAAFKVIGIGAEFEKTLVSATVKLPGNIRKGTTAYKEIEGVVRDVGKTTEFSATQSAQALNFLAMAGMDAEQSIAALPGVVDLATVAEVELQEASDIATDSLGAMGMASKNATQQQKNLTRIIDVMAATTTSANTNMVDMFESIKEGGPVAVTAGANVETYSALLGELANAGIKGTRSGTTLKNMFLALTATTPKGAKQLKKIGVATKDANGDMRDIIDIIRDLNVGLGDLGTAEKSAVLKDIFGKIPLAGVNVLLDAGADKLGAYRKQLESVTGKTAEMAKVMRDTTQGSINNLKSAIEGVIISLFKMDDKGIKGVIDAITEWIRANEGLIVSGIQDFLTSIKENIDNIVFAIKTIGTVIGVIFALVAAIKIFNAVMAIANLIAAANPIVLIILAIIAAIAVVTILIVKYWDDIAAGYWWLVDQFEKGIAATVDFFVGLGEGIKSIWDTIVEYVSSKITAMIDFFKPAVEWIMSVLGMSDEAEERAGRRADFGGGRSQMVSPQQRTVTSLEERQLTTTNRSEVTIKDSTGRAEVTRGKLGSGMNLQPTGTF
jgi:TP901 family phage tail tape measure protein